MDTLQVASKSQLKNGQQNGTKSSSNEELTLLMESEHEQPSAMPEALKQIKRQNAPSLENLFEETLNTKGESDNVQKRWVSENEIEVDGLSKRTLHSFILEAEKLGKKITYTRSLKVKISD